MHFSAFGHIWQARTWKRFSISYSLCEPKLKQPHADAFAVFKRNDIVGEVMAFNLFFVLNL